jgi:Cd2+/Zn2+-exporting ATPase
MLVSVIFVIAIILEIIYYESVYSQVAFLTATGIGLFPILYGAGISLIRRVIDIHILMVVAVAGAIASKEYLDAALVVDLFIIAELIESEVMRRVRNALKISVGGINKTATLASGATVNVDTLHINDIIAIRAGEMIMGDGEVCNGQGVVDESALTGEAVPISKKKGDKVISGTVVQNGYLEVKITTELGDSTLRKLNQAVKDVQADKGNFEKIVDKFAEHWTPFVLLSALLLAVIGGYVSGNWHSWFHRSLVLLVLACPCSIVIAAPIPSVCAIALAAKHGVLIKGVYVCIPNLRNSSQ